MVPPTRRPSVVDDAYTDSGEFKVDSYTSDLQDMIVQQFTGDSISKITQGLFPWWFQFRIMIKNF